MMQGGVVGVSVSLLVATEISERRAADSPAPTSAPEARGASAPKREGDERPASPVEGVWDVAAHDMNGDGLPDLVFATGGPGSESGTVGISINPGGDSPVADWERISFGTPADYGRVAVGDIDGDGINDVAALTFSTHVLRWWLLDADHGVRDERSMSFAGATLPGRQCEAPRPLTAAAPTLASLALADLDVDHALELGVAGYVGRGEGGLYLFSFSRRTGCFELHQGFAQATRGSLKLRFFDVDDDGSLDVVTSHYALARPSPAPEGCSDCLEWGEWWAPARSHVATPLVARFDNRALLSAEPVPELNVVDFDAIRVDGEARFALAGSAHLCPASDCWTAGHAGFVSVVDPGGRELWSSDAWKADAEQRAPVSEARLLPRAVEFDRARDQPSLVAGYWWGTRRKDSACSRVSACAGPLAWNVVGAAPIELAPDSFVQALAFSARDRGPSKQHCAVRPRRTLTLPEVPLAVLGLRSGSRVLPASAHSWVSGSNVVSLSDEAVRAGDPVCVAYATSARRDLAVADSKRGLRLISLH